MIILPEEVRAKKPSLTFNLGTNGLNVTFEPPPGQGRSATCQDPCKQQPRLKLLGIALTVAKFQFVNADYSRFAATLIWNWRTKVRGGISRPPPHASLAKGLCSMPLFDIVLKSSGPRGYALRTMPLPIVFASRRFQWDCFGSRGIDPGQSFLIRRLISFDGPSRVLFVRELRTWTGDTHSGVRNIGWSETSNRELGKSE
ncbi:hypothetical protein J6590_042095 [Homalodisca vitripennis]|nr:hypothetical protein J6590_042095 [Homalodisca vitripennis]